MAESTGERIKALRIHQGLTLAGLGQRTGLSSSYLSQIERDKTTASLATLTVIARALSVGLRYFFEDGEQAAFVVRAAEQAGDRAGAVQPDVWQRLVPDAGSSKFKVCRVIVAPHTSSGLLPEFAGEELVFMLSGQLVIEVDCERFQLAAGDSVHFDASQAHGWRNEGDDAASLLWSRVVSPLDR